LNCSSTGFVLYLQVMTSSKTTDAHPTSFRQNVVVRYLSPFVIVGITVLVWMLWPVMHSDPFAIFLAAVIVSASFFGFVPALVCTALSVLTLGFLIFPPLSNMRISRTDLERLFGFVIVSVITAGLARKRSQAETSAGEMRGRMAAIVESSDDAILSTTASGAITTWNSGAQSLYGYSEQEALGRHIAFLSPIEKAREVSRNLARVRKGEHVNNYQTEHLRKNGSRVLFKFPSHPCAAAKWWRERRRLCATLRRKSTLKRFCAKMKSSPRRGGWRQPCLTKSITRWKRWPIFCISRAIILQNAANISVLRKRK